MGRGGTQTAGDLWSQGLVTLFALTVAQQPAKVQEPPGVKYHEIRQVKGKQTTTKTFLPSFKPS